MEPTNSTTLVNQSTVPVTSSGDEFIKEPLASNIFRLIVYTVIFLLTITGNTSVLTVVYKIRELHTGRGTVHDIFLNVCQIVYLIDRTHFILVIESESVLASRNKPL